MNEDTFRFSVNTAKLSELMNLPSRKWDEVGFYDSLMLLHGGQHESGWGIITIIGCMEGVPVEIAANCTDDIVWHFLENPRMDCANESGAMHFWSRSEYIFKVGMALSSTDVWVFKKSELSNYLNLT